MDESKVEWQQKQQESKWKKRHRKWKKIRKVMTLHVEGENFIKGMVEN